MSPHESQSLEGNEKLIDFSVNVPNAMSLTCIEGHVTAGLIQKAQRGGAHCTRGPILLLAELNVT